MSGNEATYVDAGLKGLKWADLASPLQRLPKLCKEKKEKLFTRGDLPLLYAPISPLLDALHRICVRMRKKKKKDPSTRWKTLCLGASYAEQSLSATSHEVSFCFCAKGNFDRA